MSVYALTPLAKTDIFDIWSYIAGDNEETANRVEQAIYDACAFVAEAPCAAIPVPTSLAARCVSGRSPVIPTTPLFTGPRRLPFRLLPFCTAKEIYAVS
jgi:plasmid stabilization system protein ParE